VPRSVGSLTAALAGLAVVSPRTFDLDGLVSPRPEPLLAIALLQGAIGVRRREAFRCLVAVGFLTASAWVVAIERAGPIAPAVAFHVAMAGMLAVGAIFDDGIGRSLRVLGATFAAVAAATAATGRFDSTSAVPGWTVQVYPVAVAIGVACYGVLLRHRPSFFAAAFAACAWCAGLGWRAYAGLRQTVVGLDAIVLGLVLLAVAQLISLAKAGLLPGWFKHRGKSELGEVSE
jgi:hypothetical protein